MKIATGRRAAIITGVLALLIVAAAGLSSGGKLRGWFTGYRDREKAREFQAVLEGRTVTLAGEGRSLEQVLDSFSESTGVPFVVDPETNAGSVAIDLTGRDMRAIDALRLVLTLTGLGSTVRDGKVVVTERRRAEPPFVRP
jgi:type II secretory pathway component GspD/PulD (secretin)